MLYLLYNPKANNGNSEKELKDFPIDFFEGIKSEEVEMINVLSLVDYEGFLKGINSEDIIVIAGGDGTLNNFINAAKDITLTCDVYLYKLGTGNDFMYDIGEHNNNNPIKINKYIRNLPKVYINDKEYTNILVGLSLNKIYIDGIDCILNNNMEI
jgi:diacylglycerol kinase family enzyme